MPSKEYHTKRIDELKFQRDIKKNQDNRTHNTLLATLSITVIFFIFEIQKAEKSLGWIITLGISFFVLMWAINREIQYSEDEKIQQSYDVLMGRKK